MVAQKAANPVAASATIFDSPVPTRINSCPGNYDGLSADVVFGVGLREAIEVGAGFDDRSVVGEAVDDGRAEARAGERLRERFGTLASADAGDDLMYDGG
jgi:hypothetical protein